METNAAVPNKRGEFKYELLQNLKGYCMVAPAIALLCLFTIYPMFWLIRSSLYDGSLISKKRNFIGLDNYISLFNNPDFGRIVLNTAIYSVGLVIAMMVLSTLAAVWLNSKVHKRHT